MSRPRVVIVGGGFAGYEAAKVFRRAHADVTVIDRSNHYLFQPLLYQVATAALAPSDITAPIRWLLRRQKNTVVRLAEVTAVDPEARALSLDGGDTIPYDYLVIATGSHHSYFGHREWERFAPGLKSLSDAIEFRRRFLLAFEQAEWAADERQRTALLTFVVVGGGPTGVELAGVMAEIARRVLPPDFRRADPRRARVILVEAGPRLLPAYPPELSARTLKDLRELGVDVLLDSKVTEVRPESVRLGDHVIETATTFWAAGNEASGLGRGLGAPLDRVGRVLVEADLSVPGRPEIFVAGDLAAVRRNDAWIPAIAPSAMQMGRAAARNVLRLIAGQATRPFRYVDKGELATIGRSRAVARLGSLHFGGRLAWWLWLLIHIMYLAGFRNRLSVLLQWAFAYLTYQRGARLITGQSPVASRQSPVH